MGVKVYVVLGDDTVQQVPRANYCDFDDAGGDFRGDLWEMIYDAFPEAVIKEIRFVPDKPFKTTDVYNPDEEGEE
jgi:hypothetical protein